MTPHGNTRLLCRGRPDGDGAPSGLRARAGGGAVVPQRPIIGAQRIQRTVHLHPSGIQGSRGGGGGGGTLTLARAVHGDQELALEKTGCLHWKEVRKRGLRGVFGAATWGKEAEEAQHVGQILVAVDISRREEASRLA